MKLFSNLTGPRRRRTVRFTQRAWLLACAQLLFCGCMAPSEARWANQLAADLQQDEAGRAREGSALDRTDKSDDEAAAESPENGGAAADATLADDRWYLRATGESAPDDYRWRHAGVERLVEELEAQRIGRSTASPDEGPVAATNRAIAEYRAGDRRALATLTEAVGDTALSLRLRRAAAETLGRSDTREARSALRALIDDREAGYPNELAAEFWRGIVRRPEALDAARLALALKHDSAEVRRIAAEAWNDPAWGPLPDSLAQLRRDAEAGVRQAALASLAARRAPQAAKQALAALNDEALDVQAEAIRALGEVADSESVERLHALAADRREAVRVAVAAALAKADQWHRLVAMAQDSSWRVREAVATALAAAPLDQARHVAETLVRDSNARVQAAVLSAVEKWPMESAGPILLSALDARAFRTRELAVEQLQKRWPAATKFEPDATPDERAQAVAELTGAWREEFGSGVALPTTRDPARAADAASREVEAKHESAASAGAERIAVTEEAAPGAPELASLLDALLKARRDRQPTSQPLEQLSARGPSLLAELRAWREQTGEAVPAELYERVLPELSPAFAALAELAEPAAAAQRAAVEKIAALSADSGIDDLALERWAELMETCQDPIVWQDTIAALSDDPRPAAGQIARAALQQADAEVRRRACQYLQLHAERSNAQALLPLLNDPQLAVVYAAVDALGSPGNLHDPADLVGLLAERDKTLRIVAARALARLGHEQGVAALERLSQDDDPKIRLKTARAIGDVGSNAMVALCVAQLDDADSSVRNMAEENLESIVGQEALGSAVRLTSGMSSQAREWKRWWASQHQQKDGWTAPRATGE